MTENLEEFLCIWYVTRFNLLHMIPWSYTLCGFELQVIPGEL